MRLSFLSRRLRRLGTSTLSSVNHHLALQRSRSPILKHVKIDDEESGLPPASISTVFHQRLTLARMIRTFLLFLLTLVVLLLLLAYIIYKPPGFVISFLQWKYPSVIWHFPLPRGQKIIALTLDDAPSSYTPEILDLLKLHNATATFFIIGSQISGSEDLVQRIHDEGHELGNHAWKDEPSISLPLSELERQILEVDSLIPGNENGKKYFRPGSGFFNTKMMERVRGMGYEVVLGSIYPHDPQIHNPGVNARHVLSMVREGSVVIMHDRRGYSVEQVRRVLEGLSKKGWRVVSLGELIRVKEEVERGKKNG